jgi:ubiquinone/menaquinone biosynthesis C-methylase UbiE
VRRAVDPKKSRADQQIRDHYEVKYDEASRLAGSAQGEIEFLRSKEIIRRFLPPPPASVLDIGGGPGRYAFWLASLGYRVQLLDVVPKHVRQAERAKARSPRGSPDGITLGDARELPYPSRAADAVLLMGPLYHLTRRADRRRSLSEARRVLKPGGVLLAVGITRFASVLDGLFFGFLEDPAFRRIVRRDLRDGQHRNPTHHPRYFTTAFFAHPHELEREVSEAGFRVQAVIFVEGFAFWIPDLAKKWRSPAWRRTLLTVLRATESEPTLVGLGPHFIVVADRTIRRVARGRPRS